MECSLDIDFLSAHRTSVKFGHVEYDMLLLKKEKVELGIHGVRTMTITIPRSNDKLMAI